MKIIFLDHDGVICLQQQWGKRYSNRSKKKGELFDPFDKKCIKTLNEILVETNAEIVISSTWREYATLEQMQDLYKKRGIVKLPIGYTPIFKEDDSFIAKEINEYKDSYQIDARIREKEIMTFIENNPEITFWVAIDDLYMKKLKSFVHIPRVAEGIKQTGIKEKILDKLK